MVALMMHLLLNETADIIFGSLIKELLGGKYSLHLVVSL